MERDIDLFIKGVQDGMSDNEQLKEERKIRLNALYTRLKELFNMFYFVDCQYEDTIDVEQTELGIYVETQGYKILVCYNGKGHCFVIEGDNLYSEDDVIRKCGELISDHFVVRDIKDVILFKQDFKELNDMLK